MWQKDLLQLSQQMQTLQEAIQNMEVSTQRDLQMIRADLENELGKLGHSPAGLHLSKGKSCFTGKLSCEHILHSSSKGMGKDSPYMGNRFVIVMNRCEGFR